MRTSRRPASEHSGGSAGPGRSVVCGCDVCARDGEAIGGGQGSVERDMRAGRCDARWQMTRRAAAAAAQRRGRVGRGVDGRQQWARRWGGLPAMTAQ